MTLLTIVYIKTIDFYIIPILFVTFQRFAVVVTYFNKITFTFTSKLFEAKQTVGYAWCASRNRTQIVKDFRKHT